MITFIKIKEKICLSNRNKPYCYSLLFEVPEDIYNEEGIFIETIQQEQTIDLYFETDLDINVVEELGRDCEESIEKFNEIKNLYKEN